MRITSKNLSITIYYCIYVYRKSVNMKTEEQNTLELDMRYLQQDIVRFDISYM
jgi:hypothetical protein